MNSRTISAGVVLATILACTPPEAEDPASYPTSDASYSEVDAEVGCASKFSDDKKDDLFRTKYRNHWMTWTGEVLLAEADNASLNLDGVGTQDVQIDFADERAGYELLKGQRITVKFVMKTAGGCFLPFSGEFGTIQ
ncbi:MAG: hypothetical protein R3F35_01715 [Myxococcota bacterium]